MTHSVLASLSRRERQIMDVLFRLGEADVHAVQQRMPDRPSYNSVRVTLGILVDKGHVQRRKEGRRYAYAPTVTSEAESEGVLKQATRTFCSVSPSQAILAMLDMSSDQLSEDELEEISEWIERARRENKG